MDGYNYLETRTAPDVLLRLSQSLILSNMFKAHLNEGMLSSFQPGKQDALIGAAGLEFLPTSFLTLGVEANWRTFRTHPRLSDPLWITPSLTYSSPMAMGFQAGADISVARDRSTSPSRSLEPWRAFGSFTCSFNTLAGRKRLAAEKARRDSLEREALLEKVRRAEELRDSLTRQTALVDYLQAEQARRDSIRNATAAQEPSTMQQRTAPEQQLLSTGALLLDNCYFETGKTTVSINSKPYLNLIARMLTKYPKLRIEVAGHTDDVGGLNYNMNLSRLRAEAVMLYMTSVAPELRLTLTSQGYGPTKPWISNRTEEGRKYNRRTELRVLNKEMLQEYK
jgi:outer membrane protein OmpA-like peptidoglycan-associated protein